MRTTIAPSRTRSATASLGSRGSLVALAAITAASVMVLVVLVVVLGAHLTAITIKCRTIIAGVVVEAASRGRPARSA